MAKLRMKNVGILGLAALSLAGFALWARSSPRPAAAPPPYQIPKALQFVHFMGGRAVLASDHADSAISYACLQSPTGVRVVTTEKNPTTQAWEETESFHSTSYSPTSVASREGGSELYIAGIQLSHGGGWNDVLEKWVFPEMHGAYRAAMNGAPTARGVDRESYSGTVSISGGTYIPVAQRQNRPSPQRTLLYSGNAYGHIDAVEVDPEGRFLLFHSYGQGSLYSMDLMDPELPINLEFSTQQIPHLSQVHTMGAYDHPTVGRFFRLSEVNMQGKPGPTSKTTILLDVDNDGFFDSHETLTYAQKKEGVWGDEKLWHDPVNYGWDWQSEW